MLLVNNRKMIEIGEVLTSLTLNKTEIIKRLSKQCLVLLSMVQQYLKALFLANALFD